MEKSLLTIYIYNSTNGKAFFISPENQNNFPLLYSWFPLPSPIPCINIKLPGNRETTQSIATEDDFNLSPWLFPTPPLQTHTTKVNVFVEFGKDNH